MHWYAKALSASIQQELEGAEMINDLVERFYAMAPEGYSIKQEDDDSWAILGPDGQKLVFDESQDSSDKGHAKSLRRAIILALLRIQMTKQLRTP